MTENNSEQSIPEENKDTSFTEEETQKIVNAVASDIVKTTNLFQAFELVKEKAFIWASEHVEKSMPSSEKEEILKKVLDFESQNNESSQTPNPEAGATIG